jgi:hypothetical protein
VYNLAIQKEVTLVNRLIEIRKGYLLPLELDNRGRFFILSAIVLSGIAFILVLVIHAYNGSFTRYWADDYSFANVLTSEGFIGAQKYWYLQWDGRFTSTFAISLAELIGPRIVPILPSLALIIWLIAMTWTIKQFRLKIFLMNSRLLPFLLAVFVIATALSTCPDIFQSFYWQVGMLTYLVPVIILTLYAGLTAYWMNRKLQRSAQVVFLIFSVLVTFCAGGFSETYVALQTGGLLLAIGVCMLWLSRNLKQNLLPILIAGFLGSFIAMLVMVLAPGNFIRASFFPPHPDLFSLVKLSVYYSVMKMGSIGYHHLGDIGVMLVLPAMLAFTFNPAISNGKECVGSKLKTKDLVRYFVLVPVIGFVLIVFCFAPSVYGMSGPPPPRALIITQIIIICVVIYWSYQAGLALKQYHPKFRKIRPSTFYIVVSILVLALLGLGPIISAQRTLSLSSAYRDYAKNWDIQDSEFRVASLRGEKNITIKALPTGILAGLGGVGSDPNGWVNIAVARYYGFDSITAIGP